MAVEQTELRNRSDLELPPAGRYDLDPAHTTVEFTARHLVAARVRGRFATFSGSVEIAENPEESSARVTIDAASIDTHTPERDDHLRSADFFDVEQHPTLEFRSTEVRLLDGGRFELAGDLTIRGITRPVVLDGEYAGMVQDPWGGERAVFSASTTVNREDWGLTWNQALETGGVLVGKKVTISLEVEAVRQT